MKTTLEPEDIQQIAEAVVKMISPLLSNNGKEKSEDVILTVKTLAEFLEVSEQWVYERVHLKEIPFYKVGKFPRFKKSDIDKWLDALKTPAINPLSRRLRAVK